MQPLNGKWIFEAESLKIRFQPFKNTHTRMSLSENLTLYSSCIVGDNWMANQALQAQTSKTAQILK